MNGGLALSLSSVTVAPPRAQSSRLTVGLSFDLLYKISLMPDFNYTLMVLMCKCIRNSLNVQDFLTIWLDKMRTHGVSVAIDCDVMGRGPTKTKRTVRYSWHGSCRGKKCANFWSA